MPLRLWPPILRNGPIEPRAKGILAVLAAALLMWSWGEGPTLWAAPDAGVGAAAEREEDAEPGLVARLLGHRERSGVCASFSRDGRRILTAGHHSAWLWDGATYRRLSPPLAHEGTVWTAEFSRDGSKVITGSADGTARVWDAETGKRLTTLRHGELVSVASFSPDGARAVTAASDDELAAKVWDVATGRLVLEVRHDAGVEAAQFSPDGRKILTTAGSRSQLWDATTGARLHELSFGRNDFGGGAAFSPDGTKVVTGNYPRGDFVACVWDAATGKLLAQTAGHWGRVTSVAFSPDGKRFATTTDGYARVWETATGEAVTKPLGDRVSKFYAAAFSPDGSLLVAVGEGAQAAVWEVSTSKLVVDLPGCDNYVDASFSPDGKRVLTVCAEAAVTLVWDIEARRKAFDE